MSDPITHTLKHPVEIRNTKDEIVERITTVSLKRPKGKQLRAMDSEKGEMGKTMALIAACAGLPPSSVEQFDAEDILALGEIASNFLGVSFPAIGAK